MSTTDIHVCVTTAQLFIGQAQEELAKLAALGLSDGDAEIVRESMERLRLVELDLDNIDIVDCDPEEDIAAITASMHTPGIEEQLARQNEEVPPGTTFKDQNGLIVQQGAVYGIDDNGDLYDLEPLNPTRADEY